MRDVTDLRMRARHEAEVLIAAIDAGATWSAPRGSPSGLPEARLAHGTLVALMTGFGWFLNDAFLARPAGTGTPDHQRNQTEN